MFSSGKKLKDRPWLFLFIEAIIVFLSVFLALGLDSWRTSAANQEIATLALNNFEHEVRMNQEDILEAFDHHKELIEALRGDRRGVNLRPVTIRNNAWKIAQFTGAVSQLDFEIIDQASKIQELQQQYQRAAESATDLIYQGNFMPVYELEDERLQSALIYLVGPN